MNWAACLLVAVSLVPRPQEPQRETIEGPSLWGNVSIVNGLVIISGNDYKCGAGHVRKDGKIFIVWTEMDMVDGDSAYFSEQWAEYTLNEDGSITGYADDPSEIIVNGDGSLRFNRTRLVGSVLRYKR